MTSVDECISILEMAIGEAEHILPSEVIEDIMEYLRDYKRMKTAKSWDEYPECMGR